MNIDFNNWDFDESLDDVSKRKYKQFYNFLQENNLYDNYIYNFYHCKYSRRKIRSVRRNEPFVKYENLLLYLGSIKKENYILYSFDFYYTKEGKDFWDKVNEYYLYIINKKY